MKLERIAWMPLVALLIGAGDGPIALPVDPPPEAIYDLKVGAVSGALVALAWTAPYDETSTGDYASAGGYKVRYSTVGPITTEAGWASATPLAQPLPSPAEPGDYETVEVSLAGLASGTYWFAMKSWDAEHTDFDSGKGYWSDVSSPSPSATLSGAGTGPNPTPTPSPDPDPLPDPTGGAAAAGDEGGGGGGCGGAAFGGGSALFLALAMMIGTGRRVA